MDHLQYYPYQLPPTLGRSPTARNICRRSRLFRTVRLHQATHLRGIMVILLLRPMKTPCNRLRVEDCRQKQVLHIRSRMEVKEPRMRRPALQKRSKKSPKASLLAWHRIFLAKDRTTWTHSG
ncbi:hypothetical protein YQE_01376, partial [Dendroctonus ponderosae]